jgi:hypothetical protein
MALRILNERGFYQGKEGILERKNRAFERRAL